MPGRLLLAVSGGADSMALLTGSHRLQQQEFLRHLTVAHLDHGLRGSNGAADRRFVQETAAQLELPCVAGSLTPGQIAAEQGSGGEAAARRARYQFLADAATDNACAAVVTAHHQADQAETVLHNLIRGSGLRGLRGIPLTRALSAHTLCIRPMIRITRSTIDTFLRSAETGFREDASNRNVQFLRNRIRRELLPTLHRHYNQQATQHLAAIAEQAGELLNCVDAMARDILTRSLLDDGPETVRLERRPLCDTPEPLLRHTLTVLWSQQSWPRANMNQAHWQRLTQAIRTGEPRGMTLPGRIQATVSLHMLRLDRPAPESD